MFVAAPLAWIPNLAAAEPVRAAYELSWLGVQVATVEAELSETAPSYRLVWRGQTSGFLGTLYPFVSEATSQGERAAAGLRPRVHSGESLRGGHVAVQGDLAQ